jgi:hypothetical protein
MPASRLARAAYHEGARAALAVIRHLRVRRVWIRDDGSGATEYSRHLGPGEAESWTVSAFCGIAAELDRVGSAPIAGDELVIAQMIERLGLH